MTDSTKRLCEVHGEPLERRQVRVVYGLVRASPKVSPAYLATRQRQFPYSDDVALGGCVVRAAKTRSRLVCPVCCEARDAWLSLHHPAWAETHDPSGV